MPDPITNDYAEALTVRTVSGNSGTQAYRWDYETDAALVATHVTVVSGTAPTLTVQLQQLDANGNWQILAQSAAPITAAGDYLFSVGESTANPHVLAGHYRVAWTIGGTTPSFTFQVSVQQDRD